MRCQTFLTALTGAKGIFLCCQTGPTEEIIKNNKFYFVGLVDMAPIRKSRTHNNRPALVKPLATTLAVIEKLASVGWHLLNRLVPACRTGDGGRFDHDTR
jgi:hypothetical protein